METTIKTSESNTQTKMRPLPLGTIEPRIPEVWDQQIDKNKQCAVCIILNYYNSSEPVVILTRRTTTLRSHKGQIGFPGGRAETTDSGPKETALRECEEEIGIDRSYIEVQGMLPTVTGLDQSIIYPIIGIANFDTKKITPCSTEVATIVLAPVSLLTRNQSKSFEFTLFGIKRKSTLFQIEENNIWGITAQMILSADFHSETTINET